MYRSHRALIVTGVALAATTAATFATSLWVVRKPLWPTLGHES